MTGAPVLRLGIDGGGSKTRFLLVDNNDRELASLEAGPSNWLSIGPEAAARNIADGVRRLPALPNIVCGGFAGAGRPEGVQFFQNTLQTLLPSATVLVETDALTAYIGAIGLRPGVLLIAGTGSIALGRTADGRTVRAGGWGPVFGDEGGGFWIGREAVRAALRASDRGESPDFVNAVRQGLGVDTLAQAVTLWSAGKLGVPEVATIARIVIEAYPKEPAKRIVEAAAAELRALVETAERQVGVSDSPRSIVGSLGANPLLQKLIGLEFTPPIAPPERGAILLSRAKIP